MIGIRSRLKYLIRRPTILGGKRFHPKSPLATKRYESYGNRFRRSHKLSVRLGGGGGSQLCGSGSCSPDIEYGSGSAVKLLEYQFPNGSPVQVATTEDWIKFTILEVISPGAGSREGVVYIAEIFRNLRTKFNPPGCTGTVILNDYSGFYGDGDTWYLMGPVRWQVSIVAGDSCNSIGYRLQLFHHTENWEVIAEDFPSCTNARNKLVYTDVEREWFLDFGDNPEWIDYAFEDTLSTYRASYSPCSGQGVDPPDSTKLQITITDPTGIIHVGEGEPNNLTPPSISIDQGEGGDGFEVQSAKYPQVFYSVPVNYSSCNCGDFMKFTGANNIPLRDYRDWRGSGAGPFDPCKHIMAVKRVLGMPQSYTDYISYSNFPFVPKLIEMNYRVDSLGRAIKIKPKKFTRIQSIKEFMNRPLGHDPYLEELRSRKPYSPPRRSGYHT
jgi:hypothetical protein